MGSINGGFGRKTGSIPSPVTWYSLTKSITSAAVWVTAEIVILFLSGE